MKRFPPSLFVTCVLLVLITLTPEITSATVSQTYSFKTLNYFKSLAEKLFPDYPNLRCIKTNPATQIGEKNCRGESWTCPTGTPPPGQISPIFYSDKAGTIVEPGVSTTGKTVVCTPSSIGIVSKPINVPCGTQYAIDDDSGPSRLGDTCWNDKPNKEEKDNLCKAIHLGNPVNSRMDTGLGAIRRRILDDQYPETVNITESNVDAWMNNNKYDPDGDKYNIRAMMGGVQVATNAIITADLQKKYIIPESLILQAKELVKDYPALFIFMFGQIDGARAGHAVILTDVEGAAPAYSLKIADSNAAGKTLTITCRHSSYFKKTTDYVCDEPTYGSLINFAALSYSQIFNEGMAFCLDDSNKNNNLPKKDLCDRYETKGGVKKWVTDNAPFFKSNFSTPLATGGNCVGWSRTVLGVAGLGNFVGDQPIKPVANQCASSVQGEQRTSFCTNNQGACTVSAGITMEFPFEREAFTLEEFGQCAWKNKPTFPVKGSTLLREQFWLFQLPDCNGTPHNINIDTGSHYWTPIYLNFSASQEGGSAMLPANQQKSFFALMFDKAKSLVKSALAMVIAPDKPSCTQSVSTANGDFSFTYQNGYYYYHPAKVATPADFAEIDQSSSPQEYKDFTKLWISDAVFVPGSSFAWYWKPGSNSPTAVAIDQLTDKYLAGLEKNLKEKGITTSCQPNSISSRFASFLAALPDFLTLMPLPGQSLAQGQTVELKWSSRGIPASEKLELGIIDSDGNVLGTTTVANSDSYRVTIPTSLTVAKDYFFSLRTSDDRLEAFSSVFSVSPLGSFLVTASAQDGGYMSPEGVVPVSRGNSQQFTITPLNGYRLSQLIVNGQSQPRNNTGPVTYTVSNVTSNQTISAVFSPVPYVEPTLTITDSPDVVMPDQPATVSWTSQNLEGTISLSIYAGVDLVGTVKGLPTGGSHTFTLSATMPKGSGYHIYLTSDNGGASAISPVFSFGTDANVTLHITSTTTTVYRGRSATLNWTSSGLPSTDILKLRLLRNGSFVATRDIPNTGSYTFSVPNELPLGSGYTIYLEASTGFRSDPSVTFSVAEAPPATISFTNTNAITQLTVGQTVTINWKSTGVDKITFKVMKGSAEAGKVQNLPAIGSYNFTVPSLPADSDYFIRLEGGSTSIDSPKFSIVVPEAQKYTIQASAGYGGSINPSGSVQVIKGSTAMFLITPQAGFKVNSLLVDGVSTQAGQNFIPVYTFPNVDKNHNIVVSFRPGYGASPDSNQTSKSLSITYPTATTNAGKGKDFTLTWSSSGLTSGSTLTMTFYKGSQVVGSVPNIPSSDGAYKFPMPTYLPDASDYYIKLEGDGLTTQSPNFTVSSSPTSFLTGWLGASVAQLLFPWTIVK